MDEPDAPDPRNLTNEGLGTLEAFRNVSPEWLKIYKDYGGQFANEASNNYNTAYNNIVGNIGDVETSANSNIRESNLSDVQNLGADSFATIKGLNTNLQTLTDAISAQAIDDLNNAGELSARDKYDTAQLAREAGQARGNIAGNSTVYNELLNAQELKDKRQQDAVDLATTAAQLEDGYNSDALNLITGQSNATSLAVSPAATTSGYVNPTTYNPYTNAYALDLYNTNYNAAWDQYYKEGNKWENLIGGTIGLGGTLAGGFFGGPAGAEIGGKTGMAMGSAIGSMF
ncbi:MAG: hypothetical protein J6K91_05805 [Opitutales bacterium]|nr:hypothetical protein [Opitutales bacterium]